MHEAQYQEEVLCQPSSFITLTYDDKHLPGDGSLNPRHFQLFMKRLRKALQPKKIRFYHCGEYGDLLGRPHYHAAIFGEDFASDRVAIKQHRGNTYYTSALLESAWGKGFTLIGDLTFESAAYVARYIMKKQNGRKEADGHYLKISDYETGEMHRVHREYCTMSRRPGIGKEWLGMYYADVFPDDTIVFNGRKYQPPRYYLGEVESRDPRLAEEIKNRRLQRALETKEHSTPSRLAEREQVKLAAISSLLRPLDGELA